LAPTRGVAAITQIKIPIMNYTTNAASDPTLVSDVVKITERENSGVRSLSLARIAIGYVLSGTKYIHCNDCAYSVEEGSIFLLDVGFHYEENIVGANGRFEQITFYLTPKRLQQVIFGLNIKRKVCVLSPKLDVIVDFILHELHSGATLYENTGAYNNAPGKEVITIVDKNEYRKLMEFIKKTDPKAFVTVYSVSEIRYQPKTKK
jgi:hypothetical protein